MICIWKCRDRIPEGKWVKNSKLMCKSKNEGLEARYKMEFVVWDKVDILVLVVVGE